jgi:hypothetical protein
MGSIVEYTDRKPPENRYPDRIISPPHASACCRSAMEDVGDVRREAHWEYRYRRCRMCGFTLRLILRAVPDEVLLERLRQELATSFRRNVPDY